MSDPLEKYGCWWQLWLTCFAAIFVACAVMLLIEIVKDILD